MNGHKMTEVFELFGDVVYKLLSATHKNIKAKISHLEYELMDAVSDTCLH
jgi:hypothetical protein